MYNIPGVTADLKFTQDALAGIFLGTIKKWNDPEIQESEPRREAAERGHRGGSPFRRQRYDLCVDRLSGKSQPGVEEKVGASTSVNWPVGLGGKGNEGVSGPGQADTVFDRLCRADLRGSEQNALRSVRNAAGNFVKADLASVTAAAAGAAKNMPDDFRVSITNAPGKNAYPISSFTWLLIPEQDRGRTKKQAIIGFLHWMMATGQKFTEALSYAQLPKQVAAKEEKAISKIQ